ncbi:unnamed protein product [Bemisia tabaci]|uniref:Ionotropic receptor n=1 Tax=Bemisia tabaci TaxID=7038 RepID=A0A9P0ANQ6_BEMTA|nr:unnamed protein product [Bemisia tabaci]
MGISKTRSIYISNHDTNWEPSHLMRTLHENYIQTTIDNGTLQIQRREKVILLRLPDCSDILRLILGSVTNLDLTSNFSLRQSVATHEFSIPKICVEFRKRHLRQSPFQECDHLVEIDETELMPGSEISQSLFDQTRRLFHHPLWNAEKNIIFTIRRKVINVPWGFKTVSYDHRVELLFTFKFMWRFFRGRRVVVCVDQECYSYNPYSDDIIVYNADNKTYFDSALSSFPGKRISEFFYRRPTPYDAFYDFKQWTMIAPFLLEIVCHRLRGLSCEADPLIRDVASGRIDLTEAIKADADMVFVEGIVNDDDLRDYDIIPLLDDSQLCFIVPEKGEMPSYLLPAKCFSVTAWLFICITVASAIIVHELHRRMCVDLLSSEDDPHAAEFISTIFTVYSYVLCVSQSRLLDVFATGKILFVVITFGFFILTTAFVSIFVDYLSKRLRYEPLNTIEEVKESELLFKFFKAFSQDYIFMDDAEYGWMKNKMIDSSDWYLQQRYAFMPYWEIYSSDKEQLQVGSYLGINISSMAMQSLQDAEIHALYNDGYIVFLPRWALAGKNDLLSVHPFMHDPIDFHIVKECIMSYPYDVLLLSNSVYRSEIVSIIAHLKEAGIVLNKFQQTIDFSDYNFRSYDEDYESEPPRAFGMFDLRIAFIALVVGLCFSSFMFIAELLYSDKAFPSFTTILLNLSDFCRLWN